MMKIKMSDEDLKLAKDKCVSCNEEIDKEDFEQNGNYCRRCCSLAGKMVYKRHLPKQFIEQEMNKLFVEYGREDLIGKKSIMAEIRLNFE